MQEQQHMYEDEIDLVDIFIKLWKYKFFIILFTLFVTIIAIIAVNLIQPRYKTSATVAPNNKQFYRIYFKDLQSMLETNEMKIILGDIRITQYTKSIPVIFASTDAAVKALGAIAAFNSSRYKTIEDQLQYEFKITNKSKDDFFTIEVMHHSPEIAVKFTNALIEQVNEKLNNDFSPGKNVDYLIITDPPRTPQKPDWPKKELIVLISAFSSFIFSIFLALFIDWLRSAKNSIAERL